MAYGQTCSGKTYTILGVTEAPGIIPCVLRDLFSIVSEASRKIILKVSYLEIYNEKVYDLLGKQSQALKIAEDATWGCEVTGSTLYPIGSFEESLRLLEKGEKHREYGKKVNHERSSRSHTLLRIVTIVISIVRLAVG